MLVKIHEIKELVKKTGNDIGGKFWSVKTSKGDMTVFEQDILDRIEKAWEKGIEIEVDAQRAGKYVNIRAVPLQADGKVIHQEDKSQSPQDLGKPGFTPTKEYAGEVTFNPTTMYVSYAKDIFCAMLEHMKTDAAGGEWTPTEQMNHAINLVKQAHKEFS